MDPAKPVAVEILEPVAKGRYRLDDFGQTAVRLGNGAAGTVYKHPRLPGQAIKIYHTEARADEHRDKVRAMLKTTPKEVQTRKGIFQLAWPNAEVAASGCFVGFVMPLIDYSQAWKLQQAVHARQRLRNKIPERLDFRLYAARNLAALLKSLHEAGHHVIDLKPQNVMVYSEQVPDAVAHVILVDCDGFQIRGPDGRRHDADLATPEFLHPAVAREHKGEASFDKKTINDYADLQDNFALAVILFELLNNGLHPLSGKPRSANVPPDLASRLRECARYYPYGTSGGSPELLPDDDSLHGWFDPALRALFDSAFTGQTPPRPAEWLGVLGRLATSPQRCLANPDHWKLGDSCGLCACAAASAPSPRRPAVTTPARQYSPPPSPPPPLARPHAAPVMAPVQTRRGRLRRAAITVPLLLAAMLAAGYVEHPGMLKAMDGAMKSLPFVAASRAALAPGLSRRLQADLADLGYYHGRLDGVAGPETDSAAERFARDHRLALATPPDAGQLRQVLSAADARVKARKLQGSPPGERAAPPVPPTAFGTGATTTVAAALPAAADGQPVSGVPRIIDTAHLVVAGHNIALQGLKGLGGRFTDDLAAFIRNRGNWITCRFLQTGYACWTSAGIDIGLAALTNGAATASADASPRQVQAQKQAQAAHRGMWK